MTRPRGHLKAHRGEFTAPKWPQKARIGPLGPNVAWAVPRRLVLAGAYSAHVTSHATRWRDVAPDAEPGVLM
jgi:hypothetical protein